MGWIPLLGITTLVASGCVGEVGEGDFHPDEIGANEAGLVDNIVMRFEEDNWGGVGVLTNLFNQAQWENDYCSFYATFEYLDEHGDSQEFEVWLGDTYDTSWGVGRDPAAVPAEVLEAIGDGDLPPHHIEFIHRATGDRLLRRPYASARLFYVYSPVSSGSHATWAAAPGMHLTVHFAGCELGVHDPEYPGLTPG